MKKIQLGNTGILVSPLADGTGTSGWAGSSNQTRKGRNWLPDIFTRALDLGVNFWDLADMYGSHPYAARALEHIHREDVVILTKTTSTGHEDCRRDVERFLDELGTGYLDIVLLHGLTDPHWNKTQKGGMDALSECKKDKIIKAVGVSCHSLGALDAAADDPWTDVILARLNYDGCHMDADPEEVIPVVRRAKDNGKVVLAMKVLGRGSLRRDPEKAIRFVMDLGCVDAITIGPEKISHVERNIEIMEKLGY